MYIDGKLNFNEHVRSICSKASAQISTLQRLTGLVDYPSRKAIYTNFISSNFNYCPLVCFFTSRERINKIDKIQERALRFVLKDHTSNYKNLLLKSGFDSFRIYAVKSLVIELFKILERMTPNYLSELFVKVRRSCLEYAPRKHESSTVRADMFMSVMCCIIMINANPLSSYTGGREPSVWQLCRLLWYRGLSLWQPAVPQLVVGSSQWQLLSVTVQI